MQDRECIDFKQTHDTDQKIHEPCACFESLAYPVFNQSSGGSFPSYTGICLLEFFSPFINPMTLPRCWAPIRVKQLSVAATYPRDMAVRMREVLARPWVGVRVPLAVSLHCLHCFQCNRIKFNLFFINYCVS